jgi:hypothetical protein
MNQAIHIFKKDVRHLRYEIGLMLTIALVFATIQLRSASRTSDSGWTELVLVAVAMLLIGRLILAEEIPGDRQFWVTRPYLWRSLLAAKLLFIFAFVNIPILLAQISIVIVDRFPLLANLSGLVWSQILLFLVISAPSAALATLTPSLGVFVFIELALISFVVGVQELLPRNGSTQLGGAEWLRATCCAVLLVGVSAPVLYWQYKNRWTIWSRWLAAAGFVASAMILVAMPWTAALATQVLFSAQPGLGRSIQVGLASQIAQVRWKLERFPNTLYIPLAIKGVPAGTTALPDAVMLTLTGQDGKVTRLNLSNLTRHTEANGQVIIRTQSEVSSDLIDKQKDEAFTLRGSVYLTLFGNAKSTTIGITAKPANVQDGLQCYAANAHSEWDVFCRSAFRWPSRLIYAQVGDGTANAFTQSVSYSPFPASIRINPIETHWASAYAYGPPLTVRDVTILTEEPLVHLRRDFAVNSVPLSELAFPKEQMGVPPTQFFVP